MAVESHSWSEMAGMQSSEASYLPELFGVLERKALSHTAKNRITSIASAFFKTVFGLGRGLGHSG